jgi:hypothetical protein
LPGDWFDAAFPKSTRPMWDYWVVMDSRRAVEDIVAEAFARLPADRRAELLRGELTEATA